MIHGIDTGFLVAGEVIEHPSHHPARDILKRIVAAGDRFGISPQVLAEFIHVVTDAKRFTKPLDINLARDTAEKWWTAKEVSRIFLNEAAVDQFFSWHRGHALGRKRLLDTVLAATYRSAGIDSILTTNAKDFTILGGFTCIVP